MSAGGSGGGAAEAIPQNKLIAFGVIAGLVGVYLSHYLVAYVSTAFSFVGGLAAICAIVWGGAAVRRVASYGLGTGVPSIGMLALGMGVVASMFGLAVGGIAGPVIALLSAAIIGLVIGALANRVIGMGIPIMEQSMTEIASAGCLAILGLSAAMTGTFLFDAVLNNVVATGYIAVIFIAGGLAILHPFNANLGPDEKQDRTLMTGVEKGAIAMIIAGIVATTTDGAAATPTILIGLFIWYIAFEQYRKYVDRDAYEVTGVGLLPADEEGSE
ncbi:tetrahydromethanopterin S-methyltransferase subunit C [Methanohalophilus levihalophilus]|uniref:tetrahydromethanopterin S-methyltransferase subunit MtrC n=1 Tax=Methanohalophilus levihalophilus TaxID=1431282 RepID=UPI001AE40FFC|nr:tetrahydromethanopterin S-methyltransferase subunit C [Methanohalophilus levihalophilus]MBP2030755.1 tetrahydromethanopterin S-methyltransferase subunit C [Methanohalophilus levihalophilus]